MVENAVSDAGGLTDGRAFDAEARFFIAADGAGVPGADLEIDGLSRIELFGKRARGFCHQLAIAPVAAIGCGTDAEKDIRVLFREIDKADERIAVIERRQVVFGVCKPAALPFLLVIRRHIVNGVVAVILPA